MLGWLGRLFGAPKQEPPPAPPAPAPPAEELWLKAQQAVQLLLQAVEPNLPPDYLAEVDLTGVRLFVCGPEALRRLRAQHGEAEPQAAGFVAGHWRGQVNIYVLGGPQANGIPFLDPWGPSHEIAHAWHQRLMQADHARDWADHMCEGL
jgi:hypothetical protein